MSEIEYQISNDIENLIFNTWVVIVKIWKSIEVRTDDDYILESHQLNMYYKHIELNKKIILADLKKAAKDLWLGFSHSKNSKWDICCTIFNFLVS